MKLYLSWSGVRTEEVNSTSQLKFGISLTSQSKDETEFWSGVGIEEFVLVRKWEFVEVSPKSF